jgi:hypothetical protein
MDFGWVPGAKVRMKGGVAAYFNYFWQQGGQNRVILIFGA